MDTAFLKMIMEFSQTWIIYIFNSDVDATPL